MVLAIDFDGTCVTHEFPKVGKDIGAQYVLGKLINKGHQLILYTMRSDRPNKGDTGDSTIQDVSGNFLQDAVEWFKKNNIPLYGIQYNPTQQNWTTSNKCYAQLYIDDAALGCPLKKNRKFSNKPFVNWLKVEQLLINQGIL